MTKINFIDVGADKSLPIPWKKQYIKNILSFDPIGDLSYIRKNEKSFLYRCAISDVESYLPFYICEKEQNSSLLKPNYEILDPYTKNEKVRRKKIRFKIKKIIKVKCRRLDTILDELKINFDFIKIDTQGSDYFVLKSLGKYLTDNIIGIYTELFYKEAYQGSVLFKETNKFLKENNFVKFPYLPKRKHKLWNNFLYLRYDKTKKSKIKFIEQLYKNKKIL